MIITIYNYSEIKILTNTTPPIVLCLFVLQPFSTRIRVSACMLASPEVTLLVLHPGAICSLDSGRDL